MQRPEQSEYDPYYDKYISLINDEDLPVVLESQPAELSDIFKNMPEEKGKHAYEDGKWTLKEVISHLIDGERIFAYRVLRISRGDETPIEGFEQDGYIENSNANGRSFANLLNEFALQRRSNMLLLANLSEPGTKRIGTASGNTISVRALVYIMAGHIQHHIDILKNRYLQ